MKKVLVVFVLFFLIFLVAGSVIAIDSCEATPMFYLVAGSYLEKENALERQEELYMHRYYSKLMGYPIEGELYWRVVVSQDKERENLEEMKELLKEDGFETFIAYDSGDEPERPVKDPEPIPVPYPELDEEVKQSEEVRIFILELIDWLYKTLER